MTVTAEITITPYQERLLRLPAEVDVFAGGGRGSGKTRGLLLLALQHISQNGPKARALVVRRSYPSLKDAETQARGLLSVAAPGAKFNESTHTWRFSDGAVLQFGELSDRNAYDRFQGQSFTFVGIDEATQWPDPTLVDLLRSNVRSETGVTTRWIVCANPGSAGHQWVKARYVDGAEPWVPRLDSRTGRLTVWAPGNHVDNPFVDGQAYRRELAAACGGDEALLRAWLEGDWSVARGAFFADVIDIERIAVSWPLPGQSDEGDAWFAAQSYLREAGYSEAWKPVLGVDWGAARPAVALLAIVCRGYQTPDGEVVPVGSIVIVDEVETSVSPEHPNEGLGLTTEEFAARVKSMCGVWGAPATGVIDPATAAKHGSTEGSILDELQRAGLSLTPAPNERIGGWQRMRRMLKAANVDTGSPWLLVDRRCRYWWRTVPSLVRDERRPEDLQTHGVPDHAADACRYLVLDATGGEVTITWN